MLFRSQSFSSNGHGADLYKKPNHPTFSKDSKYNGVDGYQGGVWSTESNSTKFTASDTNMTFMSPNQLKRYFQQVEPGVVLEIPAKSTSQIVQ